jgi:hypothetical protein
MGTRSSGRFGRRLTWPCGCCLLLFNARDGSQQQSKPSVNVPSYLRRSTEDQRDIHERYLQR